MWRRLLGRKLLLVAGLAAGGAFVARLQAGPALDAAAPFADLLTRRLGVPVEAARVVDATAPAPSGLLGRPVEIWFTAPAGPLHDLHVATGRATAGGAPLELSTAVAITPTPGGDERLLDAAPGRALVAVAQGAAVVALSLRDRAGGRLDLQLAAPAAAATGQVTGAGFTATVDGQTVRVGPAGAEPAEAGVVIAIPPPAVPDHAATAPVIDAPFPPAAPASLGLPPSPDVAPWRPAGQGLWQAEVAGNIQLFAIDSRHWRLGLAAGVQAPPTGTGLGGRGQDAPGAAAWLDAPSGLAGLTEAGRALRPTTRLAASILMEAGRTRLGAWDRDEPAHGDLVQVATPLVLDGEVLTRRVSLGPDDARPLPRSALGATVDGVLVFAWSAAATATALGDALRAVGVQYALPAGLGPEARGLAIMGPAGLAPALPAMAPAAAWQAPRAQTALFLAPRRDFAAELDGRWRPLPGVRGAAHVRPDGVRVVVLEADAVRLALRPGAAEPWSGEGTPPALPPAEAPLALSTGVRSARAPYGLVVGERRWRAPRPDAMTLALDADGRPHLGRLGRGLDAGRAWSALVQGPALLEAGQRAVDAVLPDELPAVALGRRADGNLLLAVAPTGDVEALVAALEAEQAVDALRLADRGTADGGRLRTGTRDALSGATLPAAPVATELLVEAADPPPSVELVPAIR
ncbi:MAG: hypothetical protein H6706_18600 [Myxococcales bacterium]|nr:hypothetical protein [Myxococcales bacterium]